MNQLIIQAIGFIALSFSILSFQKNNRSTILLLMLIGWLLFALHYALLGAWTGSLMNLIESGVVFVSYRKDTDSWAKSKFWLYFFILLYLVAGLFTYKSWLDILPVVAQIFGALAVWQKNPRAIRFLMLIPRPLWFYYNLMVGSYPGVVGEVLTFISVTTGIIRFDILGKSKKVAK